MVFIDTVDYLSVRDNRIYNDCNTKFGASDKVNLYPDSATIMSILYPKDFLAKNVNRNTIQNISENEYICFQCSLHSYDTNKDSIINSLRSIYDSTKIPFLLIPIGTAAMHSDNIALSKLAKATDVPCIQTYDNSIFDIMYYIACSKMFIGTSLHGNITAMSFCIPHLTLAKGTRKLDDYLATWAAPKLDKCVEFSKFGEVAINIIGQDLSVQDRYTKLIELAKKIIFIKY